MTADDIELVVDKRFAKVNKPTRERVDLDLKESVEREGRFRDAIRYWMHNDRALIVDGHRRFKVWCSLPDDTHVKPPKVEEMKFADADEAEEWMHGVSIDRRNLSAREYSIHRGRMVKLREKRLKSGQPEEPRVSGQIVQKPPSPKATGRPRSARREATRSVAEDAGVSTKTIERDIEFVEALDAIGKVNPKAMRDIETGALPLAKGTVIAIGGLDSKDIGKALVNVRASREWDHGFNPEPAKQVQPTLEMPEQRDAEAEANALADRLAQIVDDLPEDARGPFAVRLRKLAYQIDPLDHSGKFIKPTLAEVKAYCDERENKVDPQAFVDFYDSKGWLVGKAKMKDWRAAVRNWEKERKHRNGHAKGINDDAFAEVFGDR